MKACPNDACPHRARTGERAVFVGERAACSDCDAALVACDDDARDESDPPAVPSGRGRRALASVAIMGALLAASTLPPPTLSSEDFLDPESFALARSMSPVTSAFVSAVQAFMLVEAVAILIPALRRRRHDDPRMRHRLTLTAWALTITAFVLGQVSTSRYLVDLGMREGAAPAHVASSLLGPAALFAAMGAQARWGLGGAWAPIVLAFGLVNLGGSVAQTLVFTDAGVAPGALAAQGLMLAAWAALAWGFLSGRFVRAGRESAAPNAVGLASSAYRETGPAPAAAPPRAPLRAPLWGTCSMFGAITIGAGLALERTLHLPGADLASETWQESPWLRAVAQALLGVATLAFVARLPTSLRGAKARLARLPGGRDASFEAELARARAATRTMLLAACALELLGSLARLPLATGTIGLSVMVATAIAMDLAAEWRAHRQHGALVTLARDQRVWLADALADALRARGVPAFVRNANYRQLAWWSAPQAPVAVMVPADRHDEAQELVAAWGDGGASEPDRAAPH